ncbi:chromate efflux transporter [Candidatus Thioglobus sp.]|jgi:chromate transporter|uniref:chromate efflux transporter n=1 Tax=Candidatus Thioglobus sp. TaxID=2026721 RepID=UPI001D9F945A|nr:chromate efflux transporter [Candidatus Thioglobus sp.]MBT3276444.1 chromate efflux transporter [Candidatus Thioglobus sp.]MBT3446720.1 chromate efflux transporter [Candidatus Thioglobus sp.]MBT3744908.1 chromate efflux transporter [Candidatus Thioglobus sp.]MBT4001015.1 chromate efflux transporter [Candidatus Thioglobus sp.]MBT4181625.1 chromate efflux transporter [Candidatus Thioglobus sp.]
MNTTNSPATPTFYQFFIYWLRLGFVSFGGPAGQISMMHYELVEKRRWISEHRFLHALNYTMVLPGPEAQQLATYIGWLMFGVRGGVVAGVLFVLPSLFILTALTWIYLTYGSVSEVEGVLYGIKPAVTAIVLFAAYRIGSKALSNSVLKVLAVLAFVAIFALNIPFPYIVLMAAGIGYVGAKLTPDTFVMGVHHGDSATAYGPALIDDNTPIPEHAKFKWSRVVGFAVIGVVLGFAVMSLLDNKTLQDMAEFFTKAALVTFGGAYAVLPYIYQGGVDQYQWLTATQMMDGLALGESTPGPLIMVVAFVGFVGATVKEVFGPDAILMSGFVGASVATFFTFLPSFLFIFLGGPGVEATRGDLKFSAPLSAVTAAVVGVIVNLAVFFALATWVQNSQIDWISVAITIAAFIALFRFKIGIMSVITASATVGLALSFV